MRYLIVDLECTCWAKQDPDMQFHETIEIGAVLLDENFNITSEFNEFVRPTFFPNLSEYCLELTSITQRDVDRAHKFPSVYTRFLEWSGDIDDLIFVSWGEFDLKQLQKDCSRNLVDFKLDNKKFINAKNKFASVLKHKRCGLQKAVRICQLEFEGAPHRGINDAKMVAKVFKIIMEKG